MIAENNMAKKNYFISTLLLCSLFFMGCGATNATPTEEPLASIYTSVAKTILAAPTQPAATSTPLPAPTINLTPAATLPQVATFSPAVTVPSTPASGVCTGDNGAYVSDVSVADGTVFYPGQVFTKTWLVQNNGNCTWNTSYQLIFVSGNQMGGATSYVRIPVDPGKQLQVSVALTAPGTEGTYTGYWKLANEKGSTFGSSLTVKIVSSLSAATLTPNISNSTATFTITPQKTSTNTPAPTATTAPTNTVVVAPT